MLLSKTINGALRLIGVLSAGEEASPEESEDALDRFNGMIDGFNLQNLSIPYIQEKVYQPPLGVWGNRLTIGNLISSDIIDTAPIEIDTAFFRDTTSKIDFPMTPFGLNNWSETFFKSVVAPPLRYNAQFYNRSCTIQFDTIAYPTYELHVMAKFPYVGGYLYTDDITWDYGFEEMLRYQLAARLAAEYGVQIRQEVFLFAQSQMDLIKNKNVNVQTLGIDSALKTQVSGWYDIQSGTTRA